VQIDRVNLLDLTIGLQIGGVALLNFHVLVLAHGHC
jgi:hypothetical protein